MTECFLSEIHLETLSIPVNVEEFPTCVSTELTCLIKGGLVL